MQEEVVVRGDIGPGRTVIDEGSIEIGAGRGIDVINIVVMFKSAFHPRDAELGEPPGRQLALQSTIRCRITLVISVLTNAKFCYR